jgi:hypothetical protein
MAKDPAMLWYWNDWYSGTTLMSRFLKGCYMDLLHAQFNHGHLSLEEIKICLGSDFGTSWPTIQKKFKQSDKGLFFNERLDEEKLKRQKFSESRKNNRSKKTYDTTYEKHMMPHMENENEDVNKNAIKDDFGKSENLLNEKFLITEMLKEWKTVFTNYPEKKETDYPALLQIAQFLSEKEKIDCDVGVMPVFKQFILLVKENDFYKDKSLQTISRKIQDIVIMNHSMEIQKHQTNQVAKISVNKSTRLLARRYQ